MKKYTVELDGFGTYLLIVCTVVPWLVGMYMIIATAMGAFK